MNRRFDFAPVSSAQSSLLRFTAGYFVVNGAVYGLLLVVVLIRHLLDHTLAVPTMPVVFAVLIQATTAVGLVWTGSQLSRGTRRGGLLALGFVLLPAVFALLSRESMSMTEIVLGVLGVIVLLIVWHELK